MQKEKTGGEMDVWMKKGSRKRKHPAEIVKSEERRRVEQGEKGGAKELKGRSD